MPKLVFEANLSRYVWFIAIVYHGFCQNLS
jgi:hypothetical protein